MTGTGAEADAACVAACAAGDSAGLEALYEQYAGSCLRHARSILVDQHHAEDAVQEAYLELWRNASRFDPRRSSVRSWLLMLTHRRAVDRVRVEQRRQTCVLTPELDPVDDRLGPGELALVTLAGEQARQALETLTPCKRQAIMLAYWGGYTQREIAALTGTPIGTIKTRMRSALQDLSGGVMRDSAQGVLTSG